jgi:3-oxoacyl-[acyl-carrier protein] reductase
MSLEGEIALVTGASRGIGRGIALTLGKHHAQVVGTATTEQGVRSIEKTFRDAGIRGTGMLLDVTDAISIEALIKRITEQSGTPTILVNNAGITRDNLLLRLKDDDWDVVLNTNLGSVFRISRACLRGMMKARWGRIINIASVVGLTGNPGQTNYAAAKAGMLGFTKSLAREVGSRNITVNAVAPGFIDTDMTRALPEDQRNALLADIPLGRLGDVSDIAHTVAFLASREAGYITGQTFHVNGGLFMA